MKLVTLIRLTLCASMAMVIATPVCAGKSPPRPDAEGKAPAAVEGMPPVPHRDNLYSETSAGKLAPVVRGDLARIYVPNLRSDDVYVIDPVKMKVVNRFAVGEAPQHVVPSWDLRTLWVANNAERTNDGSLTPINPRTGNPGRPIAVDDPYNLYFTPNGKSAIVVAEARKRLDFRDPHTMQLQYSIQVPGCNGINHADFSIDGQYAIFTCEFDGGVAKIDLVHRRVAGYLTLTLPKRRFAEGYPGQPFDPSRTEPCSRSRGMPQDVRISPDGKRFYVADMDADGVHVLDGAALKEIAFIPTGLGAHGLYPSRNAKRLFVANRGTHRIHGDAHGPGSVTVLDFKSGRLLQNWTIPGGGSPDMGNVSEDGRWLWLSGRFDDVVYRFDTQSGAVSQIKVGQEPHGLAVWPQPGRYSLGHTGVMR